MKQRVRMPWKTSVLRSNEPDVSQFLSQLLGQTKPPLASAERLSAYDGRDLGHGEGGIL
jgi:hypothetical protein